MLLRSVLARLIFLIAFLLLARCFLGSLSLFHALVFLTPLESILSVVELLDLVLAV